MVSLPYDLEQINNEEFKIDLYFDIKKNFLNMVFNRAKAHAHRVWKQQVKGTPEDLNSFSIGKMYYFNLRQGIAPFVFDIQTHILKDGWKILDYHIDSAIATKKNNEWVVTITIKGFWIKK